MTAVVIMYSLLKSFITIYLGVLDKIQPGLGVVHFYLNLSLLFLPPRLQQPNPPPSVELSGVPSPLTISGHFP